MLLGNFKQFPAVQKLKIKKLNAKAVCLLFNMNLKSIYIFL